MKKKPPKKAGHGLPKSKSVTSKKTKRIPAEGEIFPVVGIGASAGGLEAVTLLLEDLPDDTGMAFVFIQHLSPKHESFLVEILSRATKMKVETPRNNTQVQANTLYVISPDKDIRLEGSIFKLTKPRITRGQHLPINTFFESLAKARGGSSVGVILSGTASDGVNGLREIKNAGGLTYAQSEVTAKYSDMPLNAKKSGCVDLITSPGGIAKELAKVSRYPYLRYPRDVERFDNSIENAKGLNKIFLLLYRDTGVDFGGYKKSTLMRRIKRRMMLRNIESLDDYIEDLRKTPKEIKVLYEDILIKVTSFFRDPKVCEAVKKKVLSLILKNRSPNESIRIWVPGCASGEEAYSLAIMLLESAGNGIDGKQVQIFATDISDYAIEKARAGIYPESIKGKVSRERLRRFFIKTERGFRLKKQVREICVFAKHDLVKDPPFSNLDIISCRNVLIYMSRELQKKVMSLFHYSLKSGGFFLAGASEGASGFASMFSCIDKKNKIFLKKETSGSAALGAGTFAYSRGTREEFQKDKMILGSNGIQEDPASQLLLDKYVPVSVLVNDNLEIQRFWGETGPYLQHRPGKASLDLMRLIRKDLSIDVLSALREAKKSNIGIKKKNIPFVHDGKDRYVDIEVVPLENERAEEKLFLVLFEEVTAWEREASVEAAKPAREKGLSKDPKEIELVLLQEELDKTRDYLQSVVEGQETVTEELKSSMEELQSSNEELQSTNEELETAKEELQSTNEELSTVNEELENRNIEVEKISNDLTNLFGAVDIAIVILTEDFRVRSFNSSAQKIMNLIPGDQGRKFMDINPTINIPNVKKILRKAVDLLKMQEVEAQNAQGKWFSFRVRPYVTQDKKITGTVITVVDIDLAKKASEKVEIIARFPEENPNPVLRILKNGELVYANKPSEMIFKNWKIAVGGRVPEKWTKYVKSVLRTRKVRELEEEVEDRVFLFTLSPCGRFEYVNVYAVDITERKKIEKIKASLIRDVSHSLKTPIAIAKMAQDMSNRAIESGDTVRVKKAQKMIDEGLNEVMSDIDRILAFSVMEGRRETRSRKSVSLSEVTREVVANLKGAAANKKLKIKTVIAKGPNMILGEAGEIRLLLSNVIENAIKFTDEGQISVSVKSLAKTVKIEVKDTGCGIALKDRKKIFDKFYQRNPSVPGVGLGLAICSEIIKRYKGNLEFLSEGIGKGATVTIRLPKKKR